MRVCDIFESPVILKIWQFWYRQKFLVCLILSLALFQTNLVNASNKLSRFEIISALYERVFNIEITEIKAMDSGLLEPYEDGRYHLDWPITRGMAAQMLYTVAIQSGGANKFPRAFADIGPESEYRKALSRVGGGFLPLRGGKFLPENILNKESMYHAISTLINKKVLRQIDLSNSENQVVADPLSTSNKTNSQNIQQTKNNSYFQNITPFVNRENYDHNYMKRALRKLKHSVNSVKMQNMNPQAMTSIKNASDGLKEVKKYMHSMTASTIDLIETSTKTSKDEKAIEKALNKIDIVLKNMIERFEYSRAQLNNLVPINPNQIKKCSKLHAELTRYINDAKILCNKISSRLAERR